MLFISASYPGLYPAPDTPQLKISGFLDWEKGTFEAITDLDLGSVNIRFPAGRSQAEEILEEEYLGLIKPLLFSMQADSSSTVFDLLQRGELNLRQLDEICLGARKIPPNFSADLSHFTGNYNIKLSSLTAALVRHRQAGEPFRPIIPVPAANYTGIIIVANQPLPVRGRNSAALLEPCLFPKIWDSDMNLVYERNLTDPLVTGSGEKNMVYYTAVENIYRQTPSGLDMDLIKLVGERPLRIFANSVYGLVPTDPVIDKADALIILSNENNRRLLRDGKIILVIDEGMLGEKLN